MTFTWQSVYFVLIAIGLKNNIMDSVTILLDTGARPNIISRDFLLTDCLSKVSREVQPSLLPASKPNLKPGQNHITCQNWGSSYRCTVYSSQKLGHRRARRHSLRWRVHTCHPTRRLESSYSKFHSSRRHKTTWSVCCCSPYRSKYATCEHKVSFWSKSRSRIGDKTVEHSSSHQAKVA